MPGKKFPFNLAAGCPMTVPPLYHLQDLGTQAHQMSRNCQSPRVAMVLEYVSLGSMIVMTGVAASQVLRNAFGSLDRDQGRDRSR